MPYQDTQPPPAMHYRRDFIPGSSVPGIGYPTSGQNVVGFPPQIPDAYPHQGGAAPVPPGMLERIRSIDPGFHIPVPAQRSIDPGFQMQVPAQPSIDPGFFMPHRGKSTTIVIPPGELKGKGIDKLQDMLGPTLSPIIKALMGKKD